MKSYTYRRISAFLIDIFLVTIIATMFSSISYMNPFIDDYNQAYKEYKEVYINESNVLTSSPTIENVNNYSKILGKQIYKLDSSMVLNNIYYLIFYFLYFVVFAYFTNGQTLGKKMFKLRIVKNDDSKVKFINLLLRGIFGGSSIFIGLNAIVVIQLLLLFINNYQIYFYAMLLSAFISYIIEIIAVVMLFTKNHRSLDDLVGFTKVISEV